MTGFTSLPVQPGIEPMEAKSAKRLPEGERWLFEPKWDGFRCVAFRAGADVELQAKSGKSLTRFFPEVAARLAGLGAQQFVVDGELMIAEGESFSLDALQMRLHPAESRIRKLSRKTPAVYVLFDVLVSEAGDDLTSAHLVERRHRLERFVAEVADRLCQLKCTGVVGAGVEGGCRDKPLNPFRWFDNSPEVIRLVVMIYVRYPHSLRNVEDLLHARGIDICHETVRHWWNRFGPMFAAEIRRKRVDHMRAYTHWRWHLDEVYVTINGEMHYLWRAVDQEGEVLESSSPRRGIRLRHCGSSRRR